MQRPESSVRQLARTLSLSISVSVTVAPLTGVWLTSSSTWALKVPTASPRCFHKRSMAEATSPLPTKTRTSNEVLSPGASVEGGVWKKAPVNESATKGMIRLSSVASS